jgi:hypothetical protein
MENVLYVAVSKLALEPMLLRTQWVPRAFSMWVKHLAWVVNHSTSSVTEKKECMELYLFFPYAFEDEFYLINPLNAELNPICHFLILLGDLTFMGPCIVSIFQYIFNKMQRYTVYLYLETALHV